MIHRNLSEFTKMQLVALHGKLLNDKAQWEGAYAAVCEALNKEADENVALQAELERTRNVCVALESELEAFHRQTVRNGWLPEGARMIIHPEPGEQA